MPVLTLDTADDPRVDDYRSVRDPELARRRGLFVAEGRLVVERLIACGRYGVRSVLLNETAFSALAPAIAVLPEAVPVYIGATEMLSAVAGHHVHRGCLALGERRAPSRPGELLASARTIVILEGVGNADNVGGVFRNARAFGANAVLLGPGCCDPLYRKAIRTSMAAVLDVPFAELMPWPGALELLRPLGFTVAALTPATADRGRPCVGIQTLDSFIRAGRPERIALLVGSEGDGLTPPVAALADCCVSIPMAAGCDSVNVAVAAGIALARLFEARG